MSPESDYGGLPPHVHAMPTAMEVTPEGTKVEIVAALHGASTEEAKDALAERYGLERESITEVDPGTMSINGITNRGESRTFGFSNWGGSNWEPTGPKGNPNLN